MIITAAMLIPAVLAIVPAVFLLIKVYRADKLDKEPTQSTEGTTPEDTKTEDTKTEDTKTDKSSEAAFIQPLNNHNDYNKPSRLTAETAPSFTEPSGRSIVDPLNRVTYLSLGREKHNLSVSYQTSSG